MLNINDIIETALAVDALQTHVSADALGVDVRLRPAMERCARATLSAVRAVCPDADSCDETARAAIEMLGAYRLLAMVYGGTDAARSDFYAHAADECIENVLALTSGGCPASHTPSWT